MTYICISSLKNFCIYSFFFSNYFVIANFIDIKVCKLAEKKFAFLNSIQDKKIYKKKRQTFPDFKRCMYNFFEDDFFDFHNLIKFYRCVVDWAQRGFIEFSKFFITLLDRKHCQIHKGS